MNNIFNPITPFIDQKLEENEINKIFYQYSSNNKSLTRNEIYTLIIDIHKAFNHVPVVPNESIDLILKEIVLNEESSNEITYMEFKSYFLYLQPKPLHHLNNVSSSVFLHKDFTQTLILSYSCNKEEQINLDDIKKELHNTFGKYNVIQIFVNYHRITDKVKAMLIFDTEDNIKEIMKLTDTILILNHKIDIYRYRGGIFPYFGDKNYSTSATIAATGKLYTQKTFNKAKDIMDNYQITNKIQESTSSVYQIANNIDNKYGISGTAKNITSNISQSTKNLSDKYKIDDKVSVARANINSVLGNISENESVKSGISYLNSWYDFVSNKVSEFNNEVNEIVELKTEDEKEKSSDKVNENKEEDILKQDSDKVNENKEEDIFKQDSDKVNEIKKECSKTEDVDQRSENKEEDYKIIEKKEENCDQNDEIMNDKENKDLIKKNKEKVVTTKKKSNNKVKNNK